MIVADPFTSELVKEPASLTKAVTLDDGTALDLPGLIELGKKHSVRFLKAIQCLNIAAPLGQGLWERVPLREVLRLCGAMKNVRRIYYWGFHNNDPKQVFQSSLSYTEVIETPPGDLPPFLAYRLNGEPIPLKRGGPVRLIVPWAHGFKSIKWVQRIAVTNDFKSNDTYANQNNDPESHLKTAAYIDGAPDKYPVGQPIFLSGLALISIPTRTSRSCWTTTTRALVILDNALEQKRESTSLDLAEDGVHSIGHTMSEAVFEHVPTERGASGLLAAADLFAHRDVAPRLGLRADEGD